MIPSVSKLVSGFFLHNSLFARVFTCRLNGNCQALFRDQKYGKEINQNREEAMEIIEWLENWYSQNCDGDWEHFYGVKIENMDNPGWSVKIELRDTKLENKEFNKMHYDNGDADWLLCLVKDSVFHGDGDNHKLLTILDVFRNWAES